jgi:hypothetical protein
MGDDDYELIEIIKALSACTAMSVELLYFRPHPADPIGDACCQAIERIGKTPKGDVS